MLKLDVLARFNILKLMHSKVYTESPDVSFVEPFNEGAYLTRTHDAPVYLEYLSRIVQDFKRVL